MEHLKASIRAEIRSGGPIRFSDYMNRCLYDPQVGFYSVTGRAGRKGGDFITSVEVGALFGAVIADWLDRRWDHAGRPDPFRVAEAGAGVGTLWRSVHHSEPACLGALVWTLVEQSEAMRDQHDGLPMPDRVASVDSLANGHQHVVLANELLDNLAVDVAERVVDGWAQVLVDSGASGLALETGSADPELGFLDGLVPDAELGVRVPVQGEAHDWVVDARAIADRVLVFDYGASTAELAERPMSGWLRTYRDHERGSDPLHEPGRWDITCDVAVDQLPEPTRISTQAEWLVDNGIDARVSTAQAHWHERAHVGDLDSLRARSTVVEARALLDPAGLGGFLVLEW